VVPALCRSYASHSEALEAVNALLAAGISGEDVRVLTGEPQRDTHDEAVGEFAGGIGPGAPIGRFAGGSRARGAGQGHFAGGEQRGGSFADADREQVVTYPGGVEHARVAGHHRIKRLLISAGLDEVAAERDLKALHAGRVLVLVEASDPERLEALI
jgi:hypothetical protein